ncbi:MAG: hypothetical protein H0U76_29490 [Ktedonobacteraceae bacterium]|nr:hypothetical protein [Ktedonobacteraceae bacterium]
MNTIKTQATSTQATTQEIYEHVSVSSELTFPAAPFPRKYVHSVFNNLQDAVQAVLALLVAGYAADDIHVMTGGHFVEAVARKQTLLSFLFSFDYDVYLEEARRGRFILAVRPPSYERVNQVRDLLAPYRAHLMKYVDTWTMTELLP